MREGDVVSGKYRLQRLLGSGGMATVWSATNVFTERQVAVKFILPQLARASEATHRLLREAKISARINHPNVIEVIDVGSNSDGSFFLVMELLSGASLDSALRRRSPPFKVRDFLWVMADVARALAATHKCGVIHRDLKPSNIFLHRDRMGQIVPKVLDFGVSKILEPDAGGALTVLGTILGSPFYMSPEQALGTPAIDHRSDVFSFGSILFEGLSGQRAYEGSTFNGLIVAIATTEPRSLDQVAPWLSDPVRALVRDCMVTDRDRRIDSFEIIARRLDDLVAKLKDSDLPLPAPRPTSPSFDSILPSQGTGAASSSLSASARKITSMAPHSLPTRATASDFENAQPPGPAVRARTGRKALFAVAAVTVGIVGLSVTASSMWGMQGMPWASVANGAALISATTPSQTAAPTAVAPPQVPVVSIDSLPLTKEPAAAGSGRLSVSSLPATCAILVDGVAHGITPVQALNVDAGSHLLECRPASGQVQTAHVVVSEGAEAHYEFALKE